MNNLAYYQLIEQGMWNEALQIASEGCEKYKKKYDENAMLEDLNAWKSFELLRDTIIKTLEEVSNG